MMRESLAKVLEGDVDIAAHTLLPPVKPKPVEARTDDDGEVPRARWIPGAGRRPPMPATARTDPATQRVLAGARRILGRPKLAMYLVDTQFPDPVNAPHVLRLLQAVVDVAIRAPDEPNMGALLEQFRETEFAGDVSRLLTHRDAEVDAAVSDEEAEADLRQLRAQIEDGGLFPSAKAITMPESINGVGILALGTRRQAAPETPESAMTIAQPALRTFSRPTALALAAVLPVLASTVVAPVAQNEDDDIPFNFEDNFAPSPSSDEGHDAPF